MLGCCSVMGTSGWYYGVLRYGEGGVVPGVDETGKGGSLFELLFDRGSRLGLAVEGVCILGLPVHLEGSVCVVGRGCGSVSSVARDHFAADVEGGGGLFASAGVVGDALDAGMDVVFVCREESRVSGDVVGRLGGSCSQIDRGGAERDLLGVAGEGGGRHVSQLAVIAVASRSDWVCTQHRMFPRRTSLRRAG